MATRLYLSKTVHALAPGAAPSFEWEGAVGGPSWPTATPRTLTFAKADTLGDNGSAWSTFTAGSDYMTWQLISDPLPAQLIEGTVSGLERTRVDTGSAKAMVVIRVLSGDLSVVRGTLAVAVSSATVATGTDTSAAMPESTALTPVTAEEGDRLVVELGLRGVVSGTTARTLVGAHAAAADYSAVGDTADKNGWIEFSQTLWNVSQPIDGSVVVAAGGTGELDVSGTTDAATANVVAVVSAMGGDLDVYTPLAIAATVPAVNGAGGDLVDVVSFGEA